MKLSKVDFFRVSSKTNGRCFYCNKPAEAIDHFTPIQKYKDWEIEAYVGSPDEIDNLMPSCKSCNSRKSDMCPEDFMGHWSIAWSRYLRVNQRIGLMKDWTIRSFVYRGK